MGVPRKMRAVAVCKLLCNFVNATLRSEPATSIFHPWKGGLVAGIPRPLLVSLLGLQIARHLK